MNATHYRIILWAQYSRNVKRGALVFRLGCWEIRKKKQESATALCGSSALSAVINCLFITLQEIKQWARAGCTFNFKLSKKGGDFRMKSLNNSISHRGVSRNAPINIKHCSLNLCRDQKASTSQVCTHPTACGRWTDPNSSVRQATAKSLHSPLLSQSSTKHTLLLLSSLVFQPCTIIWLRWRWAFRHYRQKVRLSVTDVFPLAEAWRMAGNVLRNDGLSTDAVGFRPSL